MSQEVWPSNRQPYHGDLVQGGLGNCFLIASLQSIASGQPQLLKSLIDSSSWKCFFYRQGQRVEVPVILEELNDKHQYCRSTLADVRWPYIIEQAYAQFYGGRYENLVGGNTSEAFYDLLGRPVEEVDMNENGLWEKIDQGLKDRSILVTCGSVIAGGGVASSTTMANGLRTNHAYAILATFFYQQTKEKYILIHNPHGTNHLKAENQRARQSFFASIATSQPLWSNTVGTQLITWRELTRSCNRLQICHLNVEPGQVLSGDWSVRTSGGCDNFSTFYRNPYILLPLSFARKSFVILGHLIDQRSERTTETTKLSYPQIGVTLIQLKSHSIPTQDNYEVISKSRFWNKREITMEINFEPRQGHQCALVLSTFSPNVITSFWLQMFSRQNLPPVELSLCSSAHEQSIEGAWRRENSGGRRIKLSAPSTTFHRNPAYSFTLASDSTVRLILQQKFDEGVPLAQHHPVAIYVLPEEKNVEPPFTRARSISRLIHLKGDEEYHLVPSCYEPNSLGRFELEIQCDVPFTLDTKEKRLPTPPPPSPDVQKRSSSPTRRLSPPRTRRPGNTTATRVVTTTKPVSLIGARVKTMSFDYAKLE